MDIGSMKWGRCLGGHAVCRAVPTLKLSVQVADSRRRRPAGDARALLCLPLPPSRYETWPLSVLGQLLPHPMVGRKVEWGLI